MVQMTRSSTVLLAALSAWTVGFGLIAAAPAHAAEDLNEVVGRVGGAEIKAGQVRDFVQQLPVFGLIPHYRNASVLSMSALAVVPFDTFSRFS